MMIEAVSRIGLRDATNVAFNYADRSVTFVIGRCSGSLMPEGNPPTHRLVIRKTDDQTHVFGHTFLLSDKSRLNNGYLAEIEKGCKIS